MKEEGVESIKLKIDVKLGKLKYYPKEEINGLIFVETVNEINLNSNLESFDIIISLQEKIGYFYTDHKSKAYIIDQMIMKYDAKEFINNKKFEIPIKYKIPDSLTNNFHPSFRYFVESIKCIIMHSLIIEIPNLSNKVSINIFIKKDSLDKNNNNQKEEELNNTIFKDEIIKNFFFKKVGRLSYYIKTKKSLSYKEKYPIEIHLDERELGKIRIDYILMKIKKNIYIYNELHMYQYSLGKILETKKIIFNKNKETKNNVINAIFELPSSEFSPISLNDIQKINFGNKKINFTPPVNNNLFKCEYYFEIIFHFSNKLVEKRKVIIPMDFFDAEDIEKIEKSNENGKEDEKLLVNENEKINLPNDNDDNKNEFVELTKEDFIRILDGKDK